MVTAPNSRETHDSKLDSTLLNFFADNAGMRKTEDLIFL